jgi:hypothetical protein
MFFSGSMASRADSCNTARSSVVLEKIIFAVLPFCGEDEFTASAVPNKFSGFGTANSARQFPTFMGRGKGVSRDIVNCFSHRLSRRWSIDVRDNLREQLSLGGFRPFLLRSARLGGWRDGHRIAGYSSGLDNRENICNLADKVFSTSSIFLGLYTASM